MGSSSQFDIVARLQLRAEQFSSEGGRSFADLATKAKSSAAGIRDSFGQSFAEVQKLAEQSMKLPRTASGSLDLSGEIASLRESATAADQKAAVARELSAAMLAASSSSRTVTEAMRQEADAAMVAARGEEADATAIRQRILALEAVQVQLNKTASATVIHTRAANDNVVSAEQQRQSTIMLGQQLQDFSVQVASGQSVATAFSQQIGQASFALQNMGGKLAGVAAFLTSGWGIAATIAVTVLAPLVAKILDHNDALGDAVDKLKKEAIESEATSRAQDIFSRSAEGVAQALREQTKALDDGDRALQTRAEQANIDAKKELQREIGIRKTTLALIEQAKVLAQNAGGVTGPGGADSLVKAQYDGEVARLEALAKDQQSKIGQLEQNVQRTRIDLAAEAATRALDPMARIKKIYDDQAAAAQRAATAEAARGKQVDASLTRELQLIETKRQAAIKAERDRQSAASRQPTRDPDLATPASISKLLRDELGARITSTTGGKHVSNSDHYRSAAIDFVPKGGMGSLTKDQIRDVFEKAGVSIKRNAGGIEQLFGPGDKGHSDHFHVAWEKGKLAVDNYRASVRETTKATREAAQEQKQLDSALDQILGKFDPAADAARKYREKLAEIDKLARAGKITPDQEIAYVRGAKRDYTAAQSANSEQLLRDTFGDAQVTAALADFDRGVAAGVEVLANGVDDAVTSFGDGLRDAVGSAMDLLGIRINGPLRGLLQPGGIEGQANDIAKSLTDSLKNSKLGISPESIEKLSSTLGSALAGASYGQIGGSVFASITGGKQNQLGSALGGVAGKVAGDALGKTIASTVGGTLGKTLGGAAGPLGAIAGGIVGSVIGGLFKKTVKGSAGISTDGGTVSAGSASGTNATVKGQAGTLAGSVASGLQSIADQLGAVISGSSNVQIGVYKDKLRVSTNGTPIGGKGSVGAQTFTDETAAIKYAIQDALQDGVLSGISSASLKILRSGQDLERALSKALMIEAVPKDLKAMLDPVGAAIDELNRKFQKTVDALKEGGASAEQMAQAQRLYDLQLDQVKNSTAAASQGLKDFLASMKIGSNSPYSLRDQETSAKAALAPFLAQIEAGQSIDQSKYQAAAQAYLDIERQLYGSTQAYFDQLDAVQAATNKAISTIDNAKPIGGSVESPFAKATADSAAATAAAVKTANEMAQDTQAILLRIAAAAEANGGYIGVNDFIGTQRAFA
jgi:hypothetical protein